VTNVEPPPDSGPRFAQLAATSFEAIWHKLAPHRAKVRDEAISAWLEGHEADAVALAREVLTDVAAHPDLPAVAKPIFDLMLRPEHQTQAILTVLGIYPIVSSFVMAAVTPFVQDISNLAWSGHASLPLSPAELALGKLRNTLGNIDPYHEASKSGVDAQRLDILELNTGEPPGIMQVLELYRRNLLGEADVLKAVRQSRIRDEWQQAVLDLRYAPPSGSEAIMGLVKGHLNEADARTYFQESGTDPKHFDWIHATAGRPPGAQGLLGLLNRGLITEDEFGQAVRQSDIQDKWIPALLAERRYIPPARSIVPMIRSGALSDDYARELMSYHGIIPTDQDIYIKEAHSVKTNAVKELSLGSVRSMYEDGMIAKDVAITDVAKLGYSTELATQLIELVDAQRVAKYRNTAVSHVHTLFAHHRIDQSDASNELDRLGVTAPVRDELIKLWLIEQEINIVPLTLAQCQHLWRAGVIGDDAFSKRVQALGHPESDVMYLKALAFPVGAFVSQRSTKDI